jgi:hypothetical protein
MLSKKADVAIEIAFLTPEEAQFIADLQYD